MVFRTLTPGMCDKINLLIFPLIFLLPLHAEKGVWGATEALSACALFLLFGSGQGMITQTHGKGLSLPLVQVPELRMCVKMSV